MKTITLGKHKIAVSAAEERVLRTLARYDYAADLSAFESGRGRHKNNEARLVANEYAESPVGIRIYWRGELRLPGRVRKWFRRNPRHKYCVSGNVRRINNVLRKLSCLRGK